MVIKIDKNLYPNIKIDIIDNLTEKDFNEVTSYWLELYKKKKYFNFEFNIKNLNYVNPIYIFYMGIFIKKIKKEESQYLEYSKIYIYNKYIFTLLKYIFNLEKPVAPVYIYLLNEENNDIINELCINV